MSDEREFEEFVRAQASQFPYPRTPNLGASVGERLEARARKPGQVMLARAAAALVLVVAVLVASIPEARAAFREVFQIGVVSLLFNNDRAGEPDSDLAPSGLAGIEAVAGETTISDARSRAPFEIHLPTYTAGLGHPDRVYFQESLGPMVILVWLPERSAGEPLMSLHILGPSKPVVKLDPQVLEETTVRGAPAAWTQGPYLLAFDDGSRSLSRLVEGHVLIWTRGDETYRLESDLTLQEARRVAESTY